MEIEAFFVRMEEISLLELTRLYQKTANELTGLHYSFFMVVFSFYPKQVFAIMFLFI